MKINDFIPVLAILKLQHEKVRSSVKNRLMSKISSYGILGVKLLKLDNLLLNVVVVFETSRRCDSALGRRGCKAADYPRKTWENKRSHTDSISPSLAVEGAMHE